MFVLGIAGSIAGGKSTASELLQDLGATWINADAIAKTVLDQPEVAEQLIARFGDQVIDHSVPVASRGPAATIEGRITRRIDRRIDRRALGKLVFGDDDSKRLALLYLEGVIHPIVRREIMAKLTKCSLNQTRVVLLDVPLLFESHWDLACDAIWCVDAPRKDRVERIQKRGWSEDELTRRESNQMSIGRKRELSVLVIENNLTLESFAQTIGLHWQTLIKKLSPLDLTHTTDQRSASFAGQHCL